MSRLQCEAAAVEIEQLLTPMPEGCYVRVDDSSNAILIGNAALAFAITPQRVADGGAVKVALEMWPELLYKLSDYYSEKAREFRERIKEREAAVAEAEGG
jgi:hypothetical protein